MSSRRQAITTVAGFLAALAAGNRSALASPVSAGKHPDPRPGIDASKVLHGAQIEKYPDVKPVFDMIRQIPQVADGIRCQCDCIEIEEYRSLLTCFEGSGMALHCEICQNEARLAYRMHKEGKSLAEIRRAIDKEFA